MNLKNAWITIHAEEPSLICYSKVKLRGNEIHFFLKDELIFKVWLNSYNYTDLIEAGKSVHINFCDEKIKQKPSNRERD